MPWPCTRIPGLTRRGLRKGPPRRVCHDSRRLRQTKARGFSQRYDMLKAFVCLHMPIWDNSPRKTRSQEHRLLGLTETASKSRILHHNWKTWRLQRISSGVRVTWPELSYNIEILTKSSLLPVRFLHGKLSGNKPPRAPTRRMELSHMGFTWCDRGESGPASGTRDRSTTHVSR